MLNETEFSDYCIRHNFSPTARRLIDQVRSSPPSRRVKSGIANVACRFASRKMACIIQAESHRNELPAVVGWEYDGNTLEYYDQPPKIKVAYQDANGRKRGHLITPDFFVLEQDFAGWVECKTEEWLKTRAAEGSTVYVPDGSGRWRFPPGEDYAAAVGLGFRVRSSAETNWTAVRNAEFLSDYLDERLPPTTTDQLARGQAVFGGQAWIQLKGLLEADASLSADAIYSMIARGHLYVELARDLLTEPERTLVFRDALAAKAYRVHLESARLPAVPDDQAVTVAAGQSLLWDGKLWRILNVGESDLFLADDDRTVTTLPRTVLDQLVRDGTIRGLPKDISTRWNEVEQSIRTTSPDGFEQALRHYHSIFPGRSDGAPPAGTERTRRYWRAMYRASAERTGFGFIGLLPKTHLRGNRCRKLDDAVIVVMNQVIDDYFAKPGERTLVSCWGDTLNQCRERGLAGPSEKTFRAEIRRRRSYDMRLVREGEKAAYDDEEFQWYLERTAPRHGERPFEIAHIDHTEIDLQFVGSRRGENLHKAWLTVMIDAFTRVVIAWVIRFEDPSYRSCMSVIRNCIRRHGRISKYVVVDKGSDFECVYFETLLAFLESHKKTRPGGKPRFGSLVERLFGITNDAFIHNLIGNNQALQKPRRLSKSHDPRRLAVWTLPEFTEAFDGYLERVYHEAEHPALGMSPKQAMTVGLAQSGMRAHTLIPYTDNLAIMCLPSTVKGTAKIEAARGVKINYLHYWTEEFRDPLLAGINAPVRYDPNDASLAFVWLKNHWAPCRSELAADFEGRSEKEIETATQELRARFKRTGERRAITAGLIASYLRDTAVTEKALVERKRHQESVAAEDHDLKTMLGLAGPATQPTPDDSVWDNLNLKFFGDFE